MSKVPSSNNTALLQTMSGLSPEDQQAIIATSLNKMAPEDKKATIATGLNQMAPEDQQATIATGLNQMAPEDKKATIATGLNQMAPKDQQATIATGLNQMTPKDQQATINQAGIRSPGQKSSDTLWFIVVFSFAIVLVGAFLCLAIGVLVLKKSAADAELQILLTVFTSAVAFLAGLLTPGPAHSSSSQSSTQ
jgi:hypothetical protein